MRDPALAVTIEGVTRYRHCSKCHSFRAEDDTQLPTVGWPFIITFANKLGQPLGKTDAIYRSLKTMIDFRTLEKAQSEFSRCIENPEDYAIVNVYTGEAWLAEDNYPHFTFYPYERRPTALSAYGPWRLRPTALGA